jgi:phage/plasmid-like protein (TIGR03299 family)
MTANVEQMAYVGEVPWHGEGERLTQEEANDLDNLIVRAGLDWTVSKRPVMYPAALGDGGSGRQNFKDRFVLARDHDDKPYSVVSGRYKPVQPKQIMEAFRDLIELGGFQMETAGSLSDGKRIWALARTGDSAKILGQDEVASYFMLATSYDGSFSTIGQFQNIRTVCENTFYASMREYVNRISIPHLREFDAQNMKERLGIHKEAWEANRQAMELLARTKVDLAKATNVIYGIFNAVVEPTTKDAIVLKNHADNVVQLFNGTGMGSDLEASKETAWGVFNAVTEYVDHWKRARNQDSRTTSAWFGEGARIKQDAWNEVMALAA